MTAAPRLYSYVGPPELARRATGPGGRIISSADDLRRWLAETAQTGEEVIATFVVDAEGRLRIADRHSEHVACAGRQPVRAAGEITFAITHKHIHAVAVSNQSIGYCPEPESWPSVAQ